MSDNKSNNHDDFFSKATILPLVEFVIRTAKYDPELCSEDVVKEAMIPVAARIYADALNSGLTELDASLLMLLFGYTLGFEAGHIDGHVCAEGFVPDYFEEIVFRSDD